MHTIRISLSILTLIISAYATRTTIFSCDFNSQVSPNCAFLPSTGPNLQILSAFSPDLTSSQKPNRPLSDATSVVTPINGYLCNLPYKINNWDMHFCVQQNTTNEYTCPTAISNTSVCALSNYGFAFTNDTDRFERTYLSFVRNNPATNQCLTFYYYFTDTSRNPMIEVAWKSFTADDKDDMTIVTVTPQLDNKWYKSEMSFLANSSDYILKFKLSREHGIENTEFYFALDDISITSGLCGLDMQNFTLSTTDQTFIELNTSDSGATSDPTEPTDTIYLTSSSQSTLHSSIDVSQPTLIQDTSIPYESFSTDPVTTSDSIMITSSTTSKFSSLESSNADDQYSTESTISSKLPSDHNDTLSTMEQESSPILPDATTMVNNILNSTEIEMLKLNTTKMFIDTSTSILTTTMFDFTSTLDRKKSKKSTALIIGLSIGLGAPILSMLIIVLVYYRTKK